MKKLVLLLLAVSMVLTGCFGGGVASDTFIYAQEADIVNIAPVLLTNTVSSRVSHQIHEPLVKYEGNNQLVEALATDWEVSSNGLAWTFQLRPDVTWHDGQPFTAADVKYTFELLLDPATKSVRRRNFEIIKNIDTPDELTVVFNLSESHGPFLDKMTLVPIMAAHHTPNVGLETYNMNPLGTGPFQFVEWVPDDRVVLKANESYWGGKPAIEKLVFKPIPESGVRAMALEKGEVHYASGLTAEAFEKLKNNSKVETFSIPTLTFAYLGQNNQHWLFQDKRVRQAMAYAIDQESLIRDIHKGAAEPSVGPIAGISEWFNPDVPDFKYNPEQSKQMLADAGWKAGNDGILVNGQNQRFSFSVIIGSGNEIMRNQAILLQQWMQQVGIEMKLEFLDWTVMNQRLDDREYEAMMLSMGPSPDPDQFNYWHSSAISGGFNDWVYSNPQVDRLLEQGRRESNPEVRKQIYNEIQMILAEDVAALWLYHPHTLSALSTNWSGMTAEPSGQSQYLYKVVGK